MLPSIMRGPVRVHVVHVERPLRPGSRIELLMQIGPLRQRWNLQLREHQPPTRFTDEQIAGEGPFAMWQHTHVFQALDASRTRVSDTIIYELPFGLWGKLIGKMLGNLVMRLLFVSRMRSTRRLLEIPRFSE